MPAGEAATEFATDLVNKSDIHLMVEEAVHFEDIASLDCLLRKIPNKKE